MSGPDSLHQRIAKLIAESRAAWVRCMRRLVKSRGHANEIVQEEASLHTFQQGDFVDTPRARLLKEAVDRLPPQCRAAFALQVFHECPYQEIAARLGLSVETVEKHIARGLQQTHVYLRRRDREGMTRE